MFSKAKSTDFCLLSLIAFNASLAIHFVIQNWVISVFLCLVSGIISTIFLVAVEDGKRTSNNSQILLMNCLICSIFGGIMAWLI